MRNAIDKHIRELKGFLEMIPDHKLHPLDPKRIRVVLNLYYMASESHGFKEAVLASHLVRCFPQQSPGKLVGYLYHLTHYCLPTTQQIKEITGHVMTRLKKRNTLLHDHLTNAFVDMVDSKKAESVTRIKKGIQ